MTGNNYSPDGQFDPGTSSTCLPCHFSAGRGTDKKADKVAGRVEGWVNTDPSKLVSRSLSAGVLEGVAAESESSKKWLWVMMEDKQR